MVDNMGLRTLVKVYSHQLTAKFCLSKEGSKPEPNLFAVSVKEFENVTAELAMKKS